MNKRVFLLLTLVIIALLSGCGSKDVDEAEPDPIPVRLAAVTTGSIREETSFSGEVAAGSEVQVVPKTAGRISSVAVGLGQEVKKGELLVQLEAQELALGVRQAEAALEMARANLKNTKSGSALAQLKNAKEQAEANYNFNKSQLASMEKLYEAGGVSLQQLDSVRLQYRVAEGNYNLAKEQLELFERGEGQVEVLTAQVKQAEAAVEMARLQYNNARITAPVSGVVSMVSAEVGNMASPGMPVVTIVDLEGVTVTARLTEQAVLLAEQGMAVTVEVPSLGETFSGEVREVAPSPLPGTKTYTVKIKIAEGDGLRPGMFARLNLAVASVDDAVLLPRTALLEDDGQYYAFTVSDGRAVRRDLVLGLQDNQFAEIKDGFTAGETVVIVGHHYLRQDTPVLVEEVDGL